MYNAGDMNMKKTVLIVPPNDSEAMMIKMLAEKMGLPTIVSKQLHGASLDKGHDYVAAVKKGGYTSAIIIEMPGPDSEEQLRADGVQVNIIDHHHYTGLDRAHGPSGEILKSSLEQFLAMFKITDAKLKRWGFDPLMVRGIGIQDRGYIWSLQDEGYTKSQITKVMAYADELTAHLHNPKTEARKLKLAQAAWDRRKKWKEFYIVTTKANLQLRPRLSRIVADELGKPTPLLIVEHGRGLIYVQESPYALHLFERFGGFTFGLDRNWGHKNLPDGVKITLHDVKKAIETVRHDT